MKDKSPIVFFDGLCGLCNYLVDFLIRKDKKRKLFYAALQGETARQILSLNFTDNLNTLVFFENGKVYTKSTAALKAISKLGGFYAFARFFLIVPQQIRNFIYDFIAKHRYKWFDQAEVCRKPTSNEKEFFLE